MHPAAELATSSWRTNGTYLGRTYRNQASIGTYSCYIEVQTSAQVKSGSSVPAGYIGVQPVLYHDDGSIAEIGGWAYNPSTTYGYFTYLDYDYDAADYWYSQGRSRYWTGTSYSGTWYTYKTPNLLWEGC